MTHIVVTTREGNVKTVHGGRGMTVMEAIRDGGVDELEAVCGGSCSCATCHVYVDRSFAGPLPPISRDEADLLDASDHRRAESRLSCQLPIDVSLEGLRVTIAPIG